MQLMPAPAPSRQTLDSTVGSSCPEPPLSFIKLVQPGHETSTVLNTPIVEAIKGVQINTMRHGSACSQYNTELPLSAITTNHDHQSNPLHTYTLHDTSNTSSSENSSLHDDLQIPPYQQMRTSGVGKLSGMATEINRSSFNRWSDIMNNQWPEFDCHPPTPLVPTSIDTRANDLNMKQHYLWDQTSTSKLSQYARLDSIYSRPARFGTFNNDSMDFFTSSPHGSEVEWSNDKFLSTHMTGQGATFSPDSLQYHNSYSEHDMMNEAGMNAVVQSRQAMSLSDISYAENVTDTETSEYFDSPAAFSGPLDASPFSNLDENQPGIFDHPPYFSGDVSAHHIAPFAQSSPPAYGSGSTTTQYAPFGTYNQGMFDFNSPVNAHTSIPVFAMPSNALPSINIGITNTNKSSSSSRGRDTDRDDMDRKLVQWKNEGLTYREIKTRGGWGLEESTLRGRYRTLTKPKEERLRKPTWNEHAKQALIDAVENVAPPASRNARSLDALSKVPWKKVAQWMHEHRGCYKYGNATVKKKYVELINKQRKKDTAAEAQHGY